MEAIELHDMEDTLLRRKGTLFNLWHKTSPTSDCYNVREMHMTTDREGPNHRSPATNFAL